MCSTSNPLEPVTREIEINSSHITQELDTHQGKAGAASDAQLGTRGGVSVDLDDVRVLTPNAVYVDFTVSNSSALPTPVDCEVSVVGANAAVAVSLPAVAGESSQQVSVTVELADQSAERAAASNAANVVCQ